MVVMILVGNRLTFVYTARVVRATFNQPGERNLPRVSTPPRRMTAAAFVLAVTAVVMGLAATPVMTLLDGANPIGVDRKSTRLNSSHVAISYAVFCVKK